MDKKTDIWSLGIVLVEIYTCITFFYKTDMNFNILCIKYGLGEVPEINDNKILTNIKVKNYEKEIMNNKDSFSDINGIRYDKNYLRNIIMDDDFFSFIKCCLITDPERRYSIEQLKNHDFIKN